jgi:hypothetical protein
VTVASSAAATVSAESPTIKSPLTWRGLFLISGSPVRLLMVIHPPLNPNGITLGSLLAQTQTFVVSQLMSFLFPDGVLAGVEGYLHTSPAHWGEATLSVCFRPRTAEWANKSVQVDSASAEFKLRYRGSEIVSLENPADLRSLFLGQIQEQLREGVGSTVWAHDPRRGYRTVVGANAQQVGIPTEWNSFPLFDLKGGPSYLPVPPAGQWEEFQALWTKCGQCAAPFQLGLPVEWSTSFTRWICYNCI